MTKTFFARPALTLAAMLVAGSTVPAFAQDSGAFSSTHQEVSLRGVDVSSDAGVASLRNEVRHAAIRACKPEGQTMAEMQYSKACIKNAIADGMAKVDALHRQALADRSTTQTLAIRDKR
jgi:UrcA family protein